MPLAENLARFCIIFEGRTGSSYVVSVLNQHSSVLCMPEIFGKLGAGKQTEIMSAFLNGSDISQLYPFASDSKYYKKPYELKLTNDLISAYGFKTKLINVANIIEFSYFLEEHNIKLIYLSRLNIVKSVVSKLNALRMRALKGKSNADSRRDVLGPIQVDLNEFAMYLHQREKSEAWHSWFFEQHSGPKINLLYENLMKNEDTFFKCFFNFLNVEPSLAGTQETRFFKNTPDRLSEAVLNYDELLNQYIGTAYEPYFYD